jgi:hypothetical protein
VIFKTLNSKVPSALIGAFLPKGFLKSQFTLLFNAMNELRLSTNSQFGRMYENTINHINSCIDQLEENGLYSSRYYILPIFYQARELANTYYQHSDARQNADLDVSKAEKKYPFQIAGANTQIRFVVRNLGPGPASEIDLEFLFGQTITPDTNYRSISELDVETQIVEIPINVVDPTDQIEYLVQVSWMNFDGKKGQKSFQGTLLAQRADIDWERLSAIDPYSIEAITGLRPFIGRNADLAQLQRVVINNNMGSAFIHGQKRVGKTSLANELIRRVREIENVTAVYLEGGDYVEPSAEGTLSRLGQTLCRRIRKTSQLYTRIPLPEFSNSLSPFVDYLDEILDTDPTKKFLIILDEFDELPLDLYKRGPIGDAFFLTLRSISGRHRIGILLVGGEKINLIFNSQGEQLNKWLPLRLDYFDREAHWGDFQNLIRQPIGETIEFPEESIEEIYSWTSGNPFYTNILCQEIFQSAVNNKDAYISRTEVLQSVSRKLSSLGANSFQHFWEDGILEIGSTVEEISIRRRRILLAIANSLQLGPLPTIGDIVGDPLLAPIPPAITQIELNRFLERGILEERDGRYSCRVKLFGSWLRDNGRQQISTQFTDVDERRINEQIEKENHVSSEELQGLARKWGTYRGKHVNEETLRSWLNHFDNNRDKRLMFQLLGGVRFYSQHLIREKLREAMGFVRRDIAEVRLEGQKRRRDIYVTSLSNPGKSSTKYARIFARENNIIIENIVDLSKLNKMILEEGLRPPAVVIVDDIIGSGQTASQEFSSASDLYPDLFRAC